MGQKADSQAAAEREESASPGGRVILTRRQKIVAPGTPTQPGQTDAQDSNPDQEAETQISKVPPPGQTRATRPGRTRRYPLTTGPKDATPIQPGKPSVDHNSPGQATLERDRLRKLGTRTIRQKLAEPALRPGEGVSPDNGETVQTDAPTGR